MAHLIACTSVRFCKDCEILNFPKKNFLIPAAPHEIRYSKITYHKKSPIWDFFTAIRLRFCHPLGLLTRQLH